MNRLVFCIAVIMFFPLVSGAEEEKGTSDFFPVLGLYRTAQGGEVAWRPDWPLSIPPDTFSVLPHGASAITLVRERKDPAELPVEELTVRWNGDGFLSEFPLFRDDGFFQVQSLFGRGGLIRGFSIRSETSTPDTSWDILIVEYQNDFPSLIRIKEGETLYFTLIKYEAATATEVWYNQEGSAVAIFSYQYEAPGGRIRRFIRMDLSTGEEFSEEYHYDSTENISGIVTSAGEYAALYAGKGRPRYWERFVPLLLETSANAAQPVALTEEPPGDEGLDRFSFQWDAKGRLVRLIGSYREGAGQVPDGETGDVDVMETDVRYEYIQDERGAWIERRDTSMIRRSGFLIPGPEERLLRRIEYP
jgi:hypothetical protein